MKYKGHFRIDQNKTVSKNISKSTLILHNNIKDYLIWIPANIKTKNRLTEEQQRKRGMFSVLCRGVSKRSAFLEQSLS